MALIIQLNDITFTTAGLPTIGDFGELFTNDLTGLYKVQGASTYLDDSSGLGNTMVYAGTATGAELPSYASGVLTIPDAWTLSGNTRYSRYSVPAPITALPRTFMAVVNFGARNQYFIAETAGGLLGFFFNPGGYLQVVYNNGSGVVTPNFVTPVTAGAWHFLTITVDAAGAYLSVAGSAYETILFADHGGPPTPVAATLQYMGSTAGQSAYLDLAFLAVYDRYMSNTEALSSYKAVQAWCASQKSITV